MSISTSTVFDLISTASHYDLSNNTKTLELDGQQQLGISLLVSARLAELQEQIARVLPSSYACLPLTITSCFAAFGGALSKLLLVPLARNYLAKQEEDSYTKTFSETLILLDETANEWLQHADLILNTACATTYVAFIALGYPISGGIALTGLALILLKRNECLPVFLDKYIQTICDFLILSSVFILPLSPLSFIWRTLSLLACANKYFPSVLETLRSYFPESEALASFKTALPGSHRISEGHNTKQDYPDLFDLKINRSYIYAKEASQIIQDSKDPRSFSELFTDLEQRIEEEKVLLNQAQKEGLEKLKKGLVDGFYQDQLPYDVETFTKTFRELLLSILDNKIDFGAQIQELSTVGNNCIAGWTRDILCLYKPASLNAGWSVHHHLARLRSEILNTEILSLQQTIKENIQSNFVDSLFTESGNGNDIHLVQEIGRAFRHLFRPYQAEIDHATNPPSLFKTLFSLYALPNVEQEQSDFDLATYLSLLTELSPSSQPLTFFISDLLPKRLEKHFTNTQTLVDYIYEAIKPEYIEVQGSLEPRRKISWDAITSWLAEVSERRNLDLTDEKWIATDIAGSPFLTKKGVRLLLWDLGILEKKDSNS